MMTPLQILGSTFAFTACLAGSVPAASAADDNAAFQALMRGRLAEASTLAHQVLASNSGDARAHQVLCRAALAEEQADVAIDECLRAVQAAPNDSSHQMWLGRALGFKASHTNPLAAFRLAGRVHAAFERAASLNPHDVDAVSDLCEYLIFAPSLLGGDPSRATSLAKGLLPVNAARGHRLLGMIASKSGDPTRAEAEFRLAIAAGNRPESWSDLALFLARLRDYDRAIPAVNQALALDTRHGPVEVDAASILTECHRAPENAERALRNYLASNAQTDEAPVPRVHVLLGQMLEKRGDPQGARREYSAALELAPHYETAQKALDSL
jgi:Flp pilus assembly protein TadD